MGRDDIEAGPETGSQPPFLSWNLLYGLVIVALALQVCAFAVITAIYR